MPMMHIITGQAYTCWNTEENTATNLLTLLDATVEYLYNETKVPRILGGRLAWLAIPAVKSAIHDLCMSKQSQFLYNEEHICVCISTISKEDVHALYSSGIQKVLTTGLSPSDKLAMARAYRTMDFATYCTEHEYSENELAAAKERYRECKKMSESLKALSIDDINEILERM